MFRRQFLGLIAVLPFGGLLGNLPTNAAKHCEVIDVPVHTWIILPSGWRLDPYPPLSLLMNQAETTAVERRESSSAEAPRHSKGFPYPPDELSCCSRRTSE